MFLSQLKKIAFEVEVGSPLRQAVRVFQPEIHHHARLPGIDSLVMIALTSEGGGNSNY